MDNVPAPKLYSLSCTRIQYVVFLPTPELYGNTSVLSSIGYGIGNLSQVAHSLPSCYVVRLEELDAGLEVIVYSHFVAKLRRRQEQKLLWRMKK